MNFAFIEYESGKRGRLRETTVSILRPFEAESIFAEGVCGWRLKINLGREAQEGAVRRAVKMAGDFLRKNNVGITAGESFDGILRADGMTLSALFTAREADFSRDTALICGDRNVTETVLCVLCPGVRRMSLVGCRWDSPETDEYFLGEYGINIQRVRGGGFDCLRQADLIVDCRDGEGSKRIGYAAYKKSLYISLAEERKKVCTKNAERINCPEVAELFRICPEMTTEMAECALCAVSKDFFKMALGEVSVDEKMKIAENMGISALTSH